MQNDIRKKVYVIYIIIIIGVLTALVVSPLPQDPEYHNFSDQRQMIGIPHFWNVISNLPFIIVSLMGINYLVDQDILQYPGKLFQCYLFFFVGIGAVGIGSIYYHLQPGNETLFWDRLPMTIAFMAFMSIIIGEYISEKIALKFLFPLILIGMFSVIYWQHTEQAGQGDLRFYGLIQFLPMLIIPMIMLMFPARYTHTSYFWAMLSTYLLAKFFEFFDANIFSLIQLSGHTIKHVLVAIGPYLFLQSLKKRRKLSDQQLPRLD